MKRAAGLRRWPSSIDRLTAGRRSALKDLAGRAMSPVGLSVEPLYHSLARQRRALLIDRAVARVLDVGANVGQYASGLRADGYTGTIVSFEANPATVPALEAASARDPRWSVHGVALGAEAGTATMHPTIDSLSSSMLTASAEAADFGFMAELPSTVDVPVRTLDSFGFVDEPMPTLLKLDVQGYELEVLRGAHQTLAGVDVVECELSLRPIYAGQALIEDVIAALREHGFRPICLIRGFTHPSTHEVVQVDGLFVRSEP